MRKFIIFVLLATMHSAARAGEADVLDVDVSCNGQSICRFDVTVRAHDLVHGYGGKEMVIQLPIEVPTMSTIDLSEFGARYAAAWSGQDPAALASLCAENGFEERNR